MKIETTKLLIKPNRLLLLSDLKLRNINATKNLYFLFICVLFILSDICFFRVILAMDNNIRTSVIKLRYGKEDPAIDEP